MKLGLWIAPPPSPSERHPYRQALPMDASRATTEVAGELEVVWEANPIATSRRHRTPPRRSGEQSFANSTTGHKLLQDDFIASSGGEPVYPIGSTRPARLGHTSVRSDAIRAQWRRGACVDPLSQVPPPVGLG